MLSILQKFMHLEASARKQCWLLLCCLLFLRAGDLGDQKGVDEMNNTASAHDCTPVYLEYHNPINKN